MYTYFSIGKGDLNAFSQNFSQVSRTSDDSATIIAIVHYAITRRWIFLATISEAISLEILKICTEMRDGTLANDQAKLTRIDVWTMIF